MPTERNWRPRNAHWRRKRSLDSSQDTSTFSSEEIRIVAVSEFYLDDGKMPSAASGRFTCSRSSPNLRRRQRVGYEFLLGDLQAAVRYLRFPTRIRNPMSLSLLTCCTSFGTLSRPMMNIIT